MDGIYAICNNCGAMLEAPFSFGPGVTAQINVSGGTRLGCRCGGYGVIPDASYNRKPDGLFDVIATSGKSKGELLRIAQLLEEAKAKGAGITEVEAIIQNELPELARRTDFKPKNAAELAAYIALILTAITTIVGEYRRSSEPQTVIHQNFNVYQTEARKTDPKEPQKSLRSLKKKMKRKKRK